MGQSVGGWQYLSVASNLSVTSNLSKHACSNFYSFNRHIGLSTAEAQYVGKVQLDTSEGFNDYMYELDVDWFTRTIACALYPMATNSQRDGVINIKTDSTFKSTDVQFRLNTPFREDRADGTQVITTATLDGNTLIEAGWHKRCHINNRSE